VGSTEITEQLVGQRRLAGAAGAGDAHHGRLALRARRRPALAQQRQLGLAEHAVFQRGQHAADRDLVVHRRRARHLAALRAGVAGRTSACHHVLDHLHQAHAHAVVRVVDALHAVVLQLADLLGRDGAATAAEHADVAGAALAQHVDHVLEVLDVATLVTGERDRVGVLLQRGAHHVLDAPVVAEVDHFGALGLDEAAHDVDRGVMPVEQAGGGHEAQGRRLGVDVGEVGGWRAHGALQNDGDRPHSVARHARPAPTVWFGRGPGGTRVATRPRRS
jgi:hypothetical protein